MKVFLSLQGTFESVRGLGSRSLSCAAPMKLQQQVPADTLAPGSWFPHCGHSSVQSRLCLGRSHAACSWAGCLGSTGEPGW